MVLQEKRGKEQTNLRNNKRFYKPDGSWTWIYPTKT